MPPAGAREGSLVGRIAIPASTSLPSSSKCGSTTLLPRCRPHSRNRSSGDHGNVGSRPTGTVSSGPLKDIRKNDTIRLETMKDLPLPRRLDPASSRPRTPRCSDAPRPALDPRHLLPVSPRGSARTASSSARSRAVILFKGRWRSARVLTGRNALPGGVVGLRHAGQSVPSRSNAASCCTATREHQKCWLSRRRRAPQDHLDVGASEEPEITVSGSGSWRGPSATGAGRPRAATGNAAERQCAVDRQQVPVPAGCSRGGPPRSRSPQAGESGFIRHWSQRVS